MTVGTRQGRGFEHLVVLMFENRSFDNVLGHLYPPGTLPAGMHFDGVANGCYSNPSPSGRIPAHVYQGRVEQIMSSPTPDPGEEYPHVNTQLFGTVDADNAGVEVKHMKAPWNAPSAGATPTMDGFVTDYINSFVASQQRPPSPEEYAVIMGSFSPDMLPVISTLARGFAVYDAWFSGVPSQTWCNRSFFNASTSSGFVTNEIGGYRKWELNRAATIFNRLEEAGIPWAVYYDESQVVSLTGFIHAPALEPFWRTRFFGMQRFYDDVAAGRLPAYAFIEPRLIFDHNDMHPPSPALVLDAHGEHGEHGEPVPIDAHSDVRAGEILLHDVYTAIRASAAPTGSNALNTLLLVTFDEHGGCYDHVPPPTAVPPGPLGPQGLVGRTGPVVDPEMAFGFDRLGVRVPAIAISAWTKAGTVIHDEMHHGSAIATLCRKHGLPPLTTRDVDACDLTNALNLAQPRHSEDWPHTDPHRVPRRLEPEGSFTPDRAATPLTPPALSLMGALAARLGLPAESAPTTYGAAYDLLQLGGKGLFST